MPSSDGITPDNLDRLPSLDHLVRQGIYRGGAGKHLGSLRGALGWEDLSAQEVDRPDVPVTGALPEWLSGTLLRTGPAKWDLGRQQLNHWWDGLALLQRFEFQNGHVSYRARFLETPAYEAVQKNERLTWRAFAMDPCADLLAGEKTEFVPHSINANINITKIGEAIVALSETPMAMAFDPATLRALGEIDHMPTQGAWPGFHTSTPHPHSDFDRKTRYNVHTVFGEKPAYQVVATDSSGVKRVLSTLPVQVGNPGYRHHFSITDRHVIVMEYPLRLDLQTLAEHPRERLAAAFRWDPTDSTKIYVIDRSDGALKKQFETPGFFVVHHANAYETGDAIVMDVAAYDTAEHISDFYLDRRRSGSPLSLGQLRRYVLPLGSGTNADYHVLSSAQMELPTYDYRRFNTKPYRYVYSAGMRQDLPEVAYNQVVKADVETQVTHTWFQDGCFPGEPVFVPAPDAVAEDDGVILCLVLDTTVRSSFLLVLNAKDLTEVARAQLDTAIPYGLHGQFLGEHYSTL
ncbi:carotenoid oxygenase family protein [Streptomyces sp. NPDC008092]|uniref:carotenoid oxygenase family protein n=1 Tax=Streptomyces sp. NPDC008092 TaxID=3364808 RepID=UPI0036EC3F55